MIDRVSRSVDGEKSPRACSNHRSRRSCTVAVVFFRLPRSASATRAAKARSASRLPPRTVRVTQRFFPVAPSRPT